MRGLGWVGTLGRRGEAARREEGVQESKVAALILGCRASRRCRNHTVG